MGRHMDFDEGSDVVEEDGQTAKVLATCGSSSKVTGSLDIWLSCLSQLVYIVGAIGLRTTLETGVTTCGALCPQPRQR
jgi:hypothetical protein